MKKTLQTIGFLALFATSFKVYGATTSEETPPQEAARSVITRSFDDSYGLLRGKGLVIINDHWDRFLSVFHGDANALVTVLRTLTTLAPAALVEAAFAAQEARNTEAAAKAAVAADAAKQRTLFGLRSSFRGLGLEEVSEHAEYLDADLKVQSANVARIEGNIEATTAALSDLGDQGDAYREANALVLNVAKWGKSHELDPEITDPVTAATAWVARRQGRFDTDQRNKDKKDKLALAKSVLILVQDATTAEAMGAKTAAYNDQISEATARLAALKDELRVAKTALKEAESLSATAASRVKALTPKGASPTTGGAGGEGFAGTPPSGK